MISNKYNKMMEVFTTTKIQLKNKYIKIDNEQDYLETQENIYNRVLFKLQNQGHKTTEAKEEERKLSNSKEFIERNENMFKVYYQRAAIYDRLQGLSDQQIQEEVRNSPTKMKNRVRKLIKKLEKLNVVLRPDGTVDFSQVKNENLRAKLQENLYVKYALMQKDLEFEFPHKEHQMDQALVLKKQLEKVRQQQENYTRDIIQIAGSPFKMIQQIQSYENTHDSTEELAQKQKEQQRLGTIQLEQNYLQSLSKPLYESQGTYKLFETYEERMLRIEEKWLRKQLKNQDKIDDDKENRLIEIIDRLRRLKYKIDQQSYKNAKQLIFEEHEVFGEDLLQDEKHSYEDLRNYLYQTQEERRKSDLDIQNDNKINEMIQINEFYEDLSNPYDKAYLSKINLKDTIEFKKSKEQKIQELRFIKESQEGLEEDQQNALDQLEDSQENDEGLMTMQEYEKGLEMDSIKINKKDSEQLVDESKQNNEKRKIVDFINKANREKKTKSKTKVE
ncbi:hypothetical protein IMG5_194290 [Ichthyophthirius multifiliis]|uniref:Uncharacterized protein n=1 Tax=Ichthyophthirius multifiliis TaxID=5932 RepID=G0R4R0_ICHMU|nr:hypothetical protein IMG5_194290 [Ichthyophthirius multifiliis]EGR27566.1 hypothetical protein IMG5_194290 [Ichthyophthirius multifiliis]|eukprot:XP_004025018.1 hypothetical protein IMG5_194290 [Ichthyophthirius multifiliis]